MIFENDIFPVFDPMEHDTPGVDLLTLKRLATAVEIDLPYGTACLEVGTWAGLSALTLAEVFLKVYCCDHWMGNADDWLGPCEDPVLAYKTFLKNIGPLHSKQIIPLRGSSEYWSEAWIGMQEKFGLIYLDASHNFQSVCADINGWKKHLRPDGVICGHDWGVFTDVEKAVRACFPADHIHSVGRIWYVKEEIK